MIKNIILLTKIFTINYTQNINIIDKKTNKINKKSIYLWLAIIVLIAIFILTNKIVELLQRINQVEMFENIYFTFMFILLTFQAILICPNVYYFSRDTEVILPFPISPIELFLAKFNTILSILYVIELTFMPIPMLIYGTSAGVSLIFYIGLILSMLILPIFIVIIVSLINLLFINIFRLIKNENVYQFLISIILTTIIFLGEYFFIGNIIIQQQKFQETLINLNDIAMYINKTTIIINPLLEIMNNTNILKNIAELIFIYVIIFIPFSYIGSKTYLKKLLSITSYSKNKNKKLELNKECSQKSIEKAYIQNELRYITRNITFILQYIFPIAIILIVGLILSICLKTNIIQKNEEMINLFNQLNINIEGFCIALVACQILFSLINLSITAISRHGRNAEFIKYIPIDLYKQFWLKNILQIVISAIIMLVVCFIIKYLINVISIAYIALIFIDGLLLGILNSIIMLIVDIKRPLLDWKTEYEITKQNTNKIFQYVYTIAIVLLLMYFINIFKTININIAIPILTSILIAMIVIVDQFVRKQINKNKLFNKIN